MERSRGIPRTTLSVDCEIACLIWKGGFGIFVSDVVVVEPSLEDFRQPRVESHALYKQRLRMEPGLSLSAPCHTSSDSHKASRSVSNRTRHLPRSSASLSARLRV